MNLSNVVFRAVILAINNYYLSHLRQILPHSSAIIDDM